LKCWGENYNGTLGLGDRDDRGDNPGEMGDSLPAVNLGTGKTALAVSAGDGYTCALLNDHTVKCWGTTIFGQTGTGVERGTSPGSMGDNLPIVSLGTGKSVDAISLSWYFACALLTDGHLKCWGKNAIGELGLGDTLDRGANAALMGDNLPVVNLF
jgi:alpha-tubulin suppressor-like RCC1 family protein